MDGGAWVGCSPWGCEGLDKTERLHFHFSLSCIGEGNGNPLQCSCLENPRDGGAWWAAICGVAQSRTRLKRLGGGSSPESCLQKSYSFTLKVSNKFIQLFSFNSVHLFPTFCQELVQELEIHCRLCISRPCCWYNKVPQS